MTTKKLIKLFTLIFTTALFSCSLAPGMYFDTDRRGGDKESVYIENLDQDIPILNIEKARSSLSEQESYKIGSGDQIAVVVWGQNEIFPITTSVDQNLRRVDPNGNMYFPYAGIVKAEGLTQDELRNTLTDKLSEYFNDPQLDVTISRFNSQKIYVLGEVTKPQKINISDIPLTLADALGLSLGLSTNSSAASEVFIIRQPNSQNTNPQIFKANLASPSGFISASNFYLSNNDIIYINANGTTRWNRVISQFFPFSTFLNSVDRLIQD